MTNKKRIRDEVEQYILEINSVLVERLILLKEDEMKITEIADKTNTKAPNLYALVKRHSKLFEG